MEGFMDFLSGHQLAEMKIDGFNANNNFLVLNSLQLLSRSIPIEVNLISRSLAVYLPNVKFYLIYLMILIGVTQVEHSRCKLAIGYVLIP